MAVATFDTEHFISQVKKHPAIYDVNCLQYVDRAARNNAWFEVCTAVTPDWNHLTDEERKIEEKSLRSKWRNIRDYFMKEVKATKKTGRGRKRKRSSFYSHLLFLMPSVKKRGNRGNKNSKSQQMKNEILITDDIEIVTTPEVNGYTLADVALGSHDEHGGDHYQHESAVCEASIASFETEMPVDVLNTSQTNQNRDFISDDDYDKMFLLSLLPSLRQIPEHMKLHVRIQMQQILASAFHTNNHHAGQ
ncbi:uncharacterized protein [Venturia canescens]|uniref:uncharacterized protein n=1 Tax=Venturia canescens TaxID=32260 RepID=UPI001C9BCC87|nr:uncharacterized protein LOC122417034 [Venturia canescens]